MSLANKISNVWNAFVAREPPPSTYSAVSYYTNPNQNYSYGLNDINIVKSIMNRISVDVASVPIRHVKIDENGRYVQDMDSYLNDCLSVSANLDQTAKAFILDLTYSMLDDGVIAAVPTSTNEKQNPNVKDSFDVTSMRVGKIIQWQAKDVQIDIYDENTGLHENLWFKKQAVAIIENPFYSIMNAPNSTLKRLLNKMALLDRIDNEQNSAKLDLIIQLPYVVKTDIKKNQAETRRQELISQLRDSEYGIAYTDGTEKITQLNRPIENTLPQQIESLTKQLYDQLCMDPGVMNGTANADVMANYMSRVVEPCLYAITDEMNRKWLTKTARSEGHRIMFFQNIFKLMPVDKIANIADVLTRNAILSSNEFRQVLGFKPSDEPDADSLRNKNLSISDKEIDAGMQPGQDALPESTQVEESSGLTPFEQAMDDAYNQI